MTVIQQGSAYTATFVMVRSTDHITPLEDATPVVQLSSAGAPFVVGLGTVSEIGNGWYSYELSQNDTASIGELVFHCTAVGADDTDFNYQVVAALPLMAPPPPTAAFLLISSEDHISPVIGASSIVSLSKAGGPFIVGLGAIIEVGNGWYSYALSNDDINTLGELSFHCTASGADPSDFAIQIAPSILPPPPPPINASFLAFIRYVMGIPSTILPDNSIYIVMAYNIAKLIVNEQLHGLGARCGVSIYELAVNNLAGDNLINYAQDLPGAPAVPGSQSESNPEGFPFFAYSRKKWDINGFVSGVITSSNDEGTGNSMIVQDAAKGFTLQNLQSLKTIWGRTYLSLAQSWGPTTFGMS